MVVSNIFYFHPYLGKIPILTNIFQMGWFNHQPVPYCFQRFFFSPCSSCGFAHSASISAKKGGLSDIFRSSRMWGPRFLIIEKNSGASVLTVVPRFLFFRNRWGSHAPRSLTPATKTQQHRRAKNQTLQGFDLAKALGDIAGSLAKDLKVRFLCQWSRCEL